MARIILEGETETWVAEVEGKMKDGWLNFIVEKYVEKDFVQKKKRLRMADGTYRMVDAVRLFYYLAWDGKAFADCADYTALKAKRAWILEEGLPWMKRQWRYFK